MKNIKLNNKDNIKYSEIIRLIIDNEAEISISRYDDDTISNVSIFTEITQFVDGDTYDDALQKFYNIFN